MQITKADYNSHITHIVKIENDNNQHDAWGENYFKAEFQAKHSNVYVATIGADVVGFVIFWDLGVECEIINIAVASGHKQQGIGAFMLGYALESMGVDKTCFLEVDTNNIAAISLYNKFGFQVCGEITNYYGIGKNAYRMVKYL